MFIDQFWVSVNHRTSHFWLVFIDNDGAQWRPSSRTKSVVLDKQQKVVGLGSGTLFCLMMASLVSFSTAERRAFIKGASDSVGPSERRRRPLIRNGERSKVFCGYLRFRHCCVQQAVRGVQGGSWVCWVSWVSWVERRKLGKLSIFRCCPLISYPFNCVLNRKWRYNTILRKKSLQNI